MKKHDTKMVATVAVLFLVVIFYYPVLVDSSILDDESSESSSGWTYDVRITNNSRSDVSPVISCNDDGTHLVWEYHDFGFDDVYYQLSKNDGRTWTSTIRLSRGMAGLYCRYPDIATSNSNEIHVVWQDNDAISANEIRYRSSPDGGTTWLPEMMISSNDGFNSEAPKIAVSDDGMTVHVVWIDSRHGAESVPPNTELYYTRSLDGGVTWEAERRLTNALYSSTSMKMCADGNDVYILWTDDRSGNFNIYYKRSTDSGVTWSGDTLLSGTANSEGVGAIHANGTTVVASWYEQLPGPLYNLYGRISTDNGSSWGVKKTIVNSGTAMNPSIAITPDVIHFSWNDWRSGANELYYFNSTDLGSTWSAEMRLTAIDGFHSAGPLMSISGENRHLIWVDYRDGNSEIYYKRWPDFDTTTIGIVDTSSTLVKPSTPFSISCTASDNQTLDASMVSLYYEDVTGAQFGPVAASSFTGVGDWQITKADDNPNEPEDTRSYAWNLPAQPNSGEIHYWFATDDGAGNVGTVPIGANWAGPFNTILVQNVANMNQPHPAIGFVKNPLDIGINGATVQATWYNAGEGAYFIINGVTGNDGLGRPGWYQLDLYQNNWTIGDPLWVNATATYAGSQYAGQNFTLFASGDNILPDDDKEYLNITIQIQEFFELKWTLGWNIWSHPMIRSENASLGLADLPFQWFANEHWKDTSQVGAGDECTLVAWTGAAYITYVYPLDNGTVNDVTVTPDFAYWAFVGESWFTDEVALALPEQGLLVPGQYVWRHTPVRTVNVNVGWNLLGWTSFNATFSATDVIMILTTPSSSPDGVPQPELIANWTSDDWEAGNIADLQHWEGAKGYTTFVWLGTYGQSTAVHDFPVGPGYGFWVYSEVGGQTLTYITN